MEQAAQEPGSANQQQSQEPQAAAASAVSVPNPLTPMTRQLGGFQVAQKPLQKTKSPVL
jgi:hypothetical protein